MSDELLAVREALKPNLPFRTAEAIAYGLCITLGWAIAGWLTHSSMPLMPILVASAVGYATGGKRSRERASRAVAGWTDALAARLRTRRPA